MRARLWLAAFGGVLATTLAMGGIVAAVVTSGRTLDLLLLEEALAASALLGFIVAAICGVWLVRGIGRTLRQIGDGVAAGHLPESVEREAWGGLAGVAADVRELLELGRELRRREAEAIEMREAIARAREAVRRWVESERWQPLLPISGPLATLADGLDRGFDRAMTLQAQNLEAARLVRAELDRIVTDAHATSELAEHGYVEATALMTTVREIGRLASEIHQATREAPPVSEERAPELAAWRDQATGAIEELVQVSGESVEHVGAGLLKVHEIAAQVQLLSNRATLIALNAVVASGRPEAAGDGGTAELKQLAREVRAVTERVASLSDDIGRAVDSANDKMRGVRDHVVSRLEQLPVLAPARAQAAPIAHWVERLREMVQDAARKGERLSESQERVSSEAQRLTRRLEEEARDVEGLLVRLSPPGETAAAGEPATGPTRRLRVVDASENDRTEDTDPGEEMRPL